MPTFNPAWHPLLSEASAALGETELSAYADFAEAQLGIVGATYTGSDFSALTGAVARQVNWLVALDARGGGLFRSESKGAQSYTLSADRARDAGIDPEAARVVARITLSARSGEWPVAGSLR